MKKYTNKPLHVHPISNNRFECKKFVRSSIKLTLAFIVMPFFVSAQYDYAVTFKGDTLKGELKIMSYDQLDRVQWSDRGEKKVYTALQIKFIVKSGKIYEPLRYENGIQFMQVIKSGFLSLYSFSHQNAEGEYLAKKDGTGIEVPNLNFKKTMAKYLSECPDVAKRLEKGEFTKKDLDRIIDLYNNCLQSNTNQSSRVAVRPNAIDNEKILAVNNLMEKVKLEDFASKKDALDLLNDIQSKVSKNESIPNYLMEGLKSYLTPIPSVGKELEALISSLKK